MAKKKKDDGGTKRKSSSGGNARAWAAASVAGGAIVGSIGGVLATRVGIEPKTVAISETVAGAAGAVFASGNMRYASAGVLASGVGQLAIGWLQKKTAEAAAAQATQAAQQLGGNGPRQGLPPDIREAFRDARAQMEDDYAAN